MSEPFRISIVIPTYQSCSSVRRILEALARQTMPPIDFEVIVPVDGSDDGTKEMVEAFRAPYSLTALWQPNRGRAAAWNTGVRQARGRHVVFLVDGFAPETGR